MTDTPSLISDVDDTIRYWRNTGVRAADIAPQLRCHADWSTIRLTMISIERGEYLPAWVRFRFEPPVRRAA